MDSAPNTYSGLIASKPKVSFNLWPEAERRYTPYSLQPRNYSGFPYTVLIKTKG